MNFKGREAERKASPTVAAQLPRARWKTSPTPSRAPAVKRPIYCTVDSWKIWAVGENSASAEQRDLSLSERGLQGQPAACLCAAAPTFTYFCYFHRAGSPRQLLRLQRRVIERWEQEDMSLVCKAISVLFFFFPLEGTCKYLENKCAPGLKYQTGHVNADPHAGRVLCLWCCWKFHGVWQVQLMPFRQQMFLPLTFRTSWWHC